MIEYNNETMKMDFKEFLKQEKTTTDKELELLIKKKREETINLGREMLQMAEMSLEPFLRGGKRIRPMLMRLSYRLAGGETNGDLVKASLFSELMHDFILVHDDIADRDFQRHGGASLEAAFREVFKNRFGRENSHFATAMAIVGGDYLNVIAHQVLAESRFPAKAKEKCELVMARTMQEVMAGWYMHQIQNQQQIDEVREVDYLKGMKLVSASYTIESPLLLGLALAEKNTYEKELKEYAYHTGMAFQMQDDILGIYGDSRITGKPVGNDLREGKKTVLVLRAFERASGKEKVFWRERLGADLEDKEIEKMQELIKESEALDSTVKEAKRHVAEAVKAIKDIKESEEKEWLEQLAQFVVERNH